MKPDLTVRTASGSSRPAPRRKLWHHTYVQVLVAIVTGSLIGHFVPQTGQALQPLGDGFIRLVKMIIPPVIFLTIVTGIAGLRDLRAVARVAAKTFGYFLFFSTLALIVGLLTANLIRPGVGIHATAHAAVTQDSNLARYIGKAHESSVVEFVLDIIPDTFVSALTTGNILQALFVAILTGIGLALMGERGARIYDVLEEISAVAFRIVGILMKAAPIGAFGAIAYTVGKYGADSLTDLLNLVLTFYLTAILFVVVVLGVVSHLAGFSILRLLNYLRAELLLVLGTSSSESALPSLMAKMERAGCPKSIVGLVVPMGYSFNLDGTNIYMTLAALFIAQAYDIHLSLGQQVLLLGMAMLSSKGAAGVTGAGFITLAATLTILPTIPVAGIGLILGVDRFMSECRSLTNFIGNAVATIVVARWEGVVDDAKLAEALGAKPGRRASSWLSG
ncbi:C4-dicarboxylate transporter DctA [Asaia krungthepensis]|uniref:Sodium:dicarboxylate symporter n=1 Tax=Asaia krungthepensis NRIC 0535 TaxID=1307925 RepID=A0ABQ0PXN0_9PROT|nr:C4-dicarboxylate transporter DctA [Asaia krungthepensis]GBQ84145.1 sodium:dicarboxylate symporter [Asaia krungthepensis NRIC 0535]